METVLNRQLVNIILIYNEQRKNADSLQKFSKHINDVFLNFNINIESYTISTHMVQ